MKKYKSITGVALAAMFTLSACGTTGAPADQPSALPLATTQSSAAPTPTTDVVSGAKYDSQFIWDDNLAVHVKPVGLAKASATAAGAEATAGDMYLFEISIINGTGKTFDPAMFQADVNYGATGAAAQRVFDSGQGIGDNFQGKILSGKQQTVKFAYAIPADQLADVQMVVSPSFMHTEAIFTGILK